MRLENIRPNFYCLHLNKISVYFSYETPIAFNSNEKGLIVRQNDFSRTTGKHLNHLSEDKSLRVTGEEFENLLREEMTRLKSL